MPDDFPRLLYFPQWQGSGLTNSVQRGAKTLLKAFHKEPFMEVPLADHPLTTQHKISGYESLVTQLEAARTILDHHQPLHVLALLGDCGAEIAPIAYLNQRYGRELTVLWLDAHADLNTPDSSPSGHFHGMPLRLLLEGAFAFTAFQVDQPLTDQQIIFVGLRDTDVAEDRYIAEHGLPVLTDITFTVEKLEALLLKTKPSTIYVHLDLDVLNPLHFPALHYPTPGGIEVEKIAQLIRHLIKRHSVVGMSLTETTATQLDDLLPIEPILAVYREWLTTPFSQTEPEIH